MNDSELSFYLRTKSLYGTIFKILSRARFEGNRNYYGPGIVLAPHQSSVDFLAVGTAFNQPLRIVVKEQEEGSSGYFSTKLGQNGGGILFKDNALLAYRQIHRVLENKELVFIHPEGDRRQGLEEIAEPLLDITRLVENYMKRHPNDLPLPVIVVGIEYAKQLPGPRYMPKFIWPMPIVNKAIIRISEPFYPSLDSNLTNDTLMETMAKLSNSSWYGSKA